MGSGFVVMAVYRPNPRLLERQLRSLRAQTVTDWRCLIGIDGADPATQRLVESLVAGDDRFDVRTYPENVGVYRHFERLLIAVPTDVAWVALADQDDHWYDDKFARLVPLLACEGVTCVIGQARLVDADGFVLGFTDRRAGSMSEILLRNQVTGSLALFRPEVLEDGLPFPAGTDIAIHDHWLGVCAGRKGQIVLHDSPVQDYVQHDNNALGEPHQPPLIESVRRARRASGLAAHVGRVVTHRWGWRVAMARGAVGLSNGANHQATLQAVAAGGPSLIVARLIFGSVRSRRISVRDGLGFAVSVLLWPVLRGVPHV